MDKFLEGSLIPEGEELAKIRKSALSVVHDHATDETDEAFLVDILGLEDPQLMEPQTTPLVKPPGAKPRRRMTATNNL